MLRATVLSKYVEAQGLCSEPFVFLNRQNRHVTLCIAFALCSLNPLLLAQRTERLTEETEEIVELEAMVIRGDKTAKLSDESLASVGLVDAETIENFRLDSLQDTFRLLANVKAPVFVDGGFVIRGVNTEAPDAENISGSQQPLATIYVDGVALTQQGARRGPLGLWDIEQVEVFRGPQSTLQGRNSLAGAVHIHTRDPTFFWEAATRGIYGSEDTRGLAAMISGPLNDDCALRLTAEYNEADSYVKYPNLESFSLFEEFSQSISYSTRAKFLYDPENSDDFSAKLILGQSYSTPSLNDVFGPNAPTPGGVTPTNSFFDRVWLSNSAAQQVREATTQNIALDIDLTPSDRWAIKSLTTYTKTRTNVEQIDSTLIRQDKDREYAQEFRGNYSGDSLDAVFGVYTNLAENYSTQNDIEKRRLNTALFGEFDYEFMTDWHVIAGVRLDYESVDFENINATTFNRVDSSTSNTEFLPKVALLYEINEDNNIGFTVQRGYRSGGTETEVDGTPYTYDPSFTWNYELVYRSFWLDRKLAVNANLFFTDWKQQQVVVRDFIGSNASERVVNAGSSELLGAELELRTFPTPDLQMFASLGYISNSFQDFTIDVNSTLGGGPGTLNYGGYDFPESPRFNGSIGFSYEHDSGFFASCDAEYVGKYYSPVLFLSPSALGANLSVQVAQDDAVEAGDYITINPTVGYQHEHWKVSLFVRNLFDEEYLVGRTPGAQFTLGPNPVATVDNFLATVGPPRFVGVAFELKL